MCVRTVSHGFGMCTQDGGHKQHTMGACHRLALALSHYTRGVAVGTVVVGNEIQLLCSWLASLCVVVGVV